ncbi:MAG: cytochrome c peroxidase [Flavipsychrobacter sp.]
MKKKHILALMAVLILAVSATVDFNNLPNYTNQTIPNYILKDNTAPNNPMTDRGAMLGRVLFYDKKLSVDNSTACASCHKQEFAFGDTASASVGANGTTGRHSMRLINARFADERRFFWDERAATLEQQTTMPIQDHAEMGYSGLNGDPSINDLITKMNDIWYYPQLFNIVYGDPQITEQRMQQALAMFVRSIQSFDSKYDAGRAMVPGNGPPFPNFTTVENQGKQLFMAPPQFDQNGIRTGGGAGCGGCHRPPEFDIAQNSGNNGIIGKIGGGGLDFTNTRSPSLRDVVNANGQSYGGFMHTAGFNGIITLLDVVNHYDSIRQDNPNLDNRLKPQGNLQRLRLTNQEKASIVAFIRTLTGTAVYTDSRWSNPFTNDSLTIITPTTIAQLSNMASELKVYPTQATSYINIALPASMKDAQMRIVSTSGRTVYNGKVAERLDVSNYASGMYVIVFDGQQTRKFIKQ